MEHEVAVGREVPEVAGLIDALVVSVVERVLQEALGRFLAAVVVAQCEDGALDADLADLAVGHGLIALREQKHLVVRVRLADRQHVGVLDQTGHDVIRARGGRLRRAVLVDEPGLRQRELPLAQAAARHHRAGEAHLAQVLRRAALERAERGRHGQRRDAPTHGRDALVVHVLEQTLRRHEKFLRDDGRRRAEAQRQINVAHGGDVVQRRLVAQHVGTRDAHHAGVVLDVAHERVLRRDDALGRAGRAGGEDDVQRVELSGARAAVREQRRVLAAREQLLRDQDRAGKVQRLRLVVKRALHDHQIGVQRF